MALSQAQKDAAKRRRDKIMEFAKSGGYVAQKRSPGTGLSEKRTSKKGTTYYYTPWSSLSAEQKGKRLTHSKKYAAEIRDQARAYRREHPKQKQLKG